MFIYNLRSVLKQIFSDGVLEASRKDFSRVTYNVNDASNWISYRISNNIPFIVSRFGNIELQWYIQILISQKNIIRRIMGYLFFQTDYWRKNGSIINHPYFNPGDLENSLYYKATMDDVIPEIDLLASWSRGERSKYVKLKSNLPKVHIFEIEPYFAKLPWTLTLEGKKVLIIHPMVNLFIEQMKIKDKLFEKSILPNFEIIPVEALFFNDPVYDSWIKVFEYYKNKIESIEFDVAIIGCGTWGMPICKLVKDKGKGAIHLGGATQILFGIMGKRWKDWPEYSRLVNEYWITEHKEKPNVADLIEDSCYW